MITTILLCAALVCGLLGLAGVPSKFDWGSLGVLLIAIALLIPLLF